jgi:hypothetical protein
MAKMWFIVGAWSLVLTGCSVREDVSTTKAALEAINEFHHDLDSGEDGHILAEATPELQRTMGGQTSTVLFGQIRSKLGKSASTQPTNIQVNHMPVGKVIVIQLQTKFERGNAQESFAWLVQGGKPQLRGYTINSPLLANR